MSGLDFEEEEETTEVIERRQLEARAKLGAHGERLERIDEICRRFVRESDQP